MVPASSTTNEFLTSDELIDVLHGDPVLRRVALTCVLPAIRVGEEWRFRRADLDAWIGRQKMTGQATAPPAVERARSAS
jgi:excisionase family DNA binding protein